jgi:hypothetical protein
MLPTVDVCRIALQAEKRYVYGKERSLEEKAQ